MYKGYGIAFNRTGLWSFDNGFARIAVIFGSSFYTDNRKNNFLVSGEGPTDYINDNVGAAE